MKNKNDKVITAYLNSKDIYNHLVKDIKYINGIYIVYIESTKDNKVYETIIDVDKNIFSCNCDFFIHGLATDDYIVIDGKKIWLCKHIIKALEIISKFDYRAYKIYNTIKQNL